MPWQLQLQLQLGDFTLHASISGDSQPVALIGPNGAGKTTLLRAIAGAYPSASGLLQIGQHVLLDSSTQHVAPPEERGIGYVPQGYGLFPHLNVRDNVAFAWLSQQPRLSREERRQAAQAALQHMACAHLAQRMPTSLSGGEQQRVALARALGVQPRMLLLDEPFAALDVSARRSLRDALAKTLQTSQTPTLIATHDARDVWALCTQVYAIEGGKIVQQGPVAELCANPATDFIAEFFHTPGPQGPPQNPPSTSSSPDDSSSSSNSPPDGFPPDDAD